MQAFIKGDVIFSDAEPVKGTTLTIRYDHHFIGTAEVSDVRHIDIFQDEKLCGTMIVLELEWSHLGVSMQYSWRQRKEV
jgi:hypothetical protein